ncbi:hypothetical protein B9Z19DRAFT_1137135 [Tuber borchii]|uniref:Uncharacterized protein n=1 Tax=Tuber borchii TaxID=42251 RepID=A0A2T6ZB13_TUBBO|nr:hypothetical protein B9Z19DRAFT_1137135 [Tuber borchii]
MFSPSTPLLCFHQYPARTQPLLATPVSKLQRPFFEPPLHPIEAVIAHQKNVLRMFRDVLNAPGLPRGVVIPMVHMGRPGSARVDQEGRRHFPDACNIAGGFGADKEKMNDIQGLTKGAKSVEKRSLNGLKGKYYVNDKGSRLLTDLARISSELKIEIAAQKKDQAVRKKDQAVWKKDQVELRESKATIQPLQEILIAICKLAHDGNILTDTILMKRGDLDDAEIFFDIYGVGFQNSQLYLEQAIDKAKGGLFSVAVTMGSISIICAPKGNAA